jgi:hypothetical protein
VQKAKGRLKPKTVRGQDANYKSTVLHPHVDKCYVQLPRNPRTENTTIERNMSSDNNSTALSIVLMADAQARVACYSLPYGGFGFASHIITYYTIAMLVLGRKPLLPWKPLKRKGWSLILSVVQFIGTTVLSSIAIHRCRNEWQFAILGVWMLTTSITVSILTMVAPYRHLLSSSALQDPIITESQNTQQTSHREPFENRKAQTEAHLLEDSHLRGVPRDEAPEPAITNNQHPSSTIQVITGGLFAVWFLGCISGVAGIISVQFLGMQHHSLDLEQGAI